MVANSFDRCVHMCHTVCLQPPWLPQALLSVLIGMGALSSVGSAGVRITVEVEATAALAAGDSQHLSKLNARESHTHTHTHI